MASLQNIFRALLQDNTDAGDGYPVADIPLVKRHKIGISAQGNPILFISCNKPSGIVGLDYNLEMITVRFGKRCRLFLHGFPIQEDFYTVVALKEGFEDLQNYFLDIMFIMLRNLPEALSMQTLRSEIDRIVNLFNRISQPAKNTVQGLWAELLVMERSSDPQYLLKSWHYDKNGKFDFNDGINRAEVKSTSLSTRTHTFSHGQLASYDNSSLAIISVIVQQTGVGTNILGLIESIEKRLSSDSDCISLRDMVASTLGNSLLTAESIFFDYSLACESIAYFDVSSIPNLSQCDVPREISNIRFDVDLTNASQIIFDDSSCILYRSICSA